MDNLADLLGEEISTLISADERSDVDSDGTGSDTSAERLRLRGDLAESQPAASRLWAYFLNDFMSGQKKFRGRTKKGPPRGCFGIKMDRIGAASGLGC
nr:PREDICTED: C-type natriuretic peptide-like [Latimeria chalumnae]|eukprot:XP_014349800.1 PREDICTED: C-type natriuretic peptide-like [Latimeria chalumnae]